MMILTSSLEQEIEEYLNSSFKEFFRENYLWLIILVIVIAIILFLHLITHSNDKLEQEIRTLKIRIRSLENQIQNPNSSSNTTSLEEISNQIQDLKDELKNSSPQ